MNWQRQHDFQSDNNRPLAMLRFEGGLTSALCNSQYWSCSMIRNTTYPQFSKGGSTFEPVKSSQFLLFPAAFPFILIPCFWHASIWLSGIFKFRAWSCFGASMKVMVKPASTCHSIWQWKSVIPGLSALKRITAFPPPLIRTTSRRIGVFGGGAVEGGRGGPSSGPGPEREITWKLWECKWNGWAPPSKLIIVSSTIAPRGRTTGLEFTPYIKGLSTRFAGALRAV